MLNSNELHKAVPIQIRLLEMESRKYIFEAEGCIIFDEFKAVS